MTFREKYEAEHPEGNYRTTCPYYAGYESTPACPEASDGSCLTCNACWDRAIPEKKEENKMIYAHIVNPDPVGENLESPGVAASSEEKEKEKENKPMKKTKAMLEEELDQKRAEIEDLKKELETEIKKTEKYKLFEECADDLKALQNSFINSGFGEKQAFMMILQIIGAAYPRI